MRGKSIHIVLGLVLILCFTSVAFAAGGSGGLSNFVKTNTYSKGQFSDVRTSEWYYSSVKAAYEYGLVKGNGNGAFNVNGNITIAETLALACRLNSIYYGGNGGFRQGEPWYQVYVDYALKNNIISKGDYSSYTAKATRAQFATILSKALPDEALSPINSVSSLPDVSTRSSYYSSVLKLYNAGILTGSDSKGTFNPNSNIVRTEVAAIVTRMADKSLRKKISLISGQNMTIHFINVGQGDCTFIDFGDREILIDAGTIDYGNAVCSYIKPYVDGKLDYVIATHMDADHIGGMPAVLSSYQVGCIIDSGERDKTTSTATAFIKAAKAEGCTYTGDYNTTVSLGNGAYFDIIETGDDYPDSNDNSVVSQIRYGSFSALFTGDMTSATEYANLSKFSKVNILKAGHHGSRSSTCQPFLNKVKPEVVIISAAAVNSYGHPHADLLNRLLTSGIKVYGTYKGGTIVVTTDGATYSLNKSIQLKITDTCDENVKDYVHSDFVPISGPGTTVSDPGTRSTDPGATATTTYIGNKNTKKFHYSWCSSVSQMAEKNKVQLSSRAAAISAGYVPCKVCKP